MDLIEEADRYFTQELEIYEKKLKPKNGNLQPNFKLK